jgi:hypothetical protein
MTNRKPAGVTHVTKWPKKDEVTPITRRPGGVTHKTRRLGGVTNVTRRP